jgi:hypothetical protein
MFIAALLRWLKTTQIINGRMGETIVGYSYNGILFTHKKE